uniref:C2 domain-containing protein n=1 Tax=Craspedostauros australis TaxID=1486917 RepID=A0A7R9WM40_9STRA
MVNPNAPSVTITVHAGRNLVAKDKNMLGKKTTSDPYVQIFAHNDSKQQLGKTQTKPRTLGPTWEQSFKIPLDLILREQQKHNGGPNSSLLLVIYDRDLVGSNDAMGSVYVPIDSPSSQKWHTVTNGAKPHFCKNASGELLVSVSIDKPLSIVPGNMIPVQSSQIDVGLAWDADFNLKNAVDLDAACVALDRNGKFLMDETVYYGNLSNRNGSITHSGDERTGESSGDDERISVQLNRIPSNVLALYIILSVATPKKTLEQVRSTRVNIYRKQAAATGAPGHNNGSGSGKPICQFVPSERGPFSTMFLARLARDSTTSDDWMLCPLEVGDPHARDFGSVIPHVKGFTRDLLPNIDIDAGERIAVMRKNGVIRLRDFGTRSLREEFSQTEDVENATFRELSFGLAWDITNGANIDLDASILCLGADYSLKDQVFFNRKTSDDGAIQHSGDERSGASAGDDETIRLKLSDIDPSILYLGITINSYSGQELDDVSRASCHLYDTAAKRDIMTYTLTNAQELDKYTALLVGCLYRTSGNSVDWMMRLISEPGHGKLAKDLLGQFQNFLRNNPPPEPEVVIEPEIDLSYTMPAFKPIKEDEDIVL